MELERSELVWLRTLAAEFAAASKTAHGGRVFFDHEWMDGVVDALRVITDKPKRGKHEPRPSSDEEKDKDG